MTTTRIVCTKCGRSEDLDQALADGWLYATMVAKANQGYMVIRCPEHITDYARRQAGLRQEYYHEHKTPYDRARLRVSNSPALKSYEDIIFYDWPEGDEHLTWVATAPIKEIVDWAKTVRQGEAEAVQE
jgi:thiaminase